MIPNTKSRYLVHIPSGVFMGDGEGVGDFHPQRIS